MGSFSWIYSDTNEAMLNNVCRKSYLLIPEPFQKELGEYIVEDCYEGYGEFGPEGRKRDIFELIADWNRDFIPFILKLDACGNWRCGLNRKDRLNLQQFYFEGKGLTCEKRCIGILMACFDADNAHLPFGIKITSRPMKYAEAALSKADPNQGFGVEYMRGGL